MAPTLSASLLAPAATLVIWSLIIMLWMMAKRLPAMFAAKIPRDRLVGGRGQDLEKILPPRINWPSHNYTHLFEQPTIFYATVIMLAVLGQGTQLNLTLAWSYVGLRVIHSLWQIQVNTIPVRALLFFISSGVLIALAINLLSATLK